jgi:hypothetical protein
MSRSRSIWAVRIATGSPRSSTPASPGTAGGWTAKAFLRTYGFLASLLPCTQAEWEKLSIFLVPRLPAPVSATFRGPTPTACTS